MAGKNEFESLKYLSQIHRQQFDERRKIEWKIIYTLLGAYGSLIGIRLSGRLPFGENANCLIWIVIGGIAVIASLYLQSIHRANRINKKIAEAAESKLVGFAGIDDEVKDALKVNQGVTENWSLNLQILTIVAFAIVTGLLLTLT